MEVLESPNVRRDTIPNPYKGLLDSTVKGEIGVPGSLILPTHSTDFLLFKSVFFLDPSLDSRWSISTHRHPVKGWTGPGGKGVDILSLSTVIDGVFHMFWRSGIFPGLCWIEVLSFWFEKEQTPIDIGPDSTGPMVKNKVEEVEWGHSTLEGKAEGPDVNAQES